MADLVSAGSGMRGQSRGISSMPSGKKKSKLKRGAKGSQISLFWQIFGFVCVLGLPIPANMMEEKSAQDIENVSGVSFPLIPLKLYNH
jgi:hypothetical protein